MAIPIKAPPTLVGKAAEEFYERWANAKDNTSKEKAQESMREFKIYWAEQERLNPSPWSI
jgi:hypothetical protein